LQIRTKTISCHTADSKPVKQKVKGTVILPPLVFPGIMFMRFISRRQMTSMKSFMTLATDHDGEKVHRGPTEETPASSVGRTQPGNNAQILVFRKEKLYKSNAN